MDRYAETVFFFKLASELSAARRSGSYNPKLAQHAQAMLV